MKVKQRVTLFLNPEIVKQAKAQALNEGDISLSKLVEKALERYLPKEVVVTIVEQK